MALLFAHYLGRVGKLFSSSWELAVVETRGLGDTSSTSFPSRTNIGHFAPSSGWVPTLRAERAVSAETRGSYRWICQIGTASLLSLHALHPDMSSVSIQCPQLTACPRA